MNYSVDFKAMAAWIGVAVALSSGIYLLTGYNLQNSQGFQISLEEDTAPGELTRLTVMREDQPVQGANISIDEEFIGTTNSQGIKGFDTPEDNFTVKASKGDVSSQTNFTVEDGFFSSPDDSEGSDNGEDSDDSSDGSNNQDDSEDTVDSDNGDQPDDGQDDQDQQQDDTTEEISNDFTGLELDEDPLVGELRTLTVYEDGEEVSGAEVTVNGEVVGTTNTGGTISFGVPDSAQISISTDTGLSETFSVVDYTEEEQNQRDDQNDTEDLTTGIELDSDPVSGTTNRIILYDEGDRVSGETVYLDGNELGQTGSNGAIEFEVPLKEQITVTTDYGLGSQTFNVTENHPEPDITLLNPTDTASFDTPTGTNTDVTFEASVDITESSGTASLMIDGSEAYIQDLSSGTNSISTTQALSSGSHNWQVEVDTPEHNISSSSRSLSVNEVEVQNGLSLQSTATAGEYNYVRLYDSGEPVEGQGITVNGDSIGNADSSGEVGFEVPNVPEITISSSSPSYEKTYAVEGYEPPAPEDNLVIESPEYELYNQKNVQLRVNFSHDQADSYKIYLDGSIYSEGVLDSDKEVSSEMTLTEGSHTVEAEMLKSGEILANSSKTFTVDPLESPFTLHHPNNTEINDFETYFYFEIDNDRLQASNYEIIMDGSTIHSGTISSTGQVRIGDGQTITEVIPDSGQHSWKVRTTGKTPNTSKELSFTTAKDQPDSTNLDIGDPAPGASSSGQTEFTWNVSAPKGSGYNVYWITNVTRQGPVPIGEDEDGGSKEYSYLYDYGNTGSYIWNITVRDNQTSDIITSKQRELQYVE